MNGRFQVVYMKEAVVTPVISAAVMLIWRFGGEQGRTGVVVATCQMREALEFGPKYYHHD